MEAIWREISHSMRRNKLRTFLTAASIAWGIILLIFLLGSGNAVRNGLIYTQKTVGGDRKMINVYLYKTRKPYAGFQSGRRLSMNRSELNAFRQLQGNRVAGVYPTYTDVVNIESQEGQISSNLQTIVPIDLRLGNLKLKSGRLPTLKECETGAPVLLIHDRNITKLFPGRESPLGKQVSIYGSLFTVIGVIEETSVFGASYKVPYESYMRIFPNMKDRIKNINIYPHPGRSNAEINAYSKNIGGDLARILHFDPEGTPYGIENSAEGEDMIGKLFFGLNIFLWLVGISVLSIGVVGVSNIMQVSVQERMKEIGIRKAIGAKPRDIMRMVLGESIALSVLSGFIGLLLGLVLLKVMDFLSEVGGWGTKSIRVGDEDTPEMVLRLFMHPEVNLTVAIAACVILILAGVIAGYGPARNAIRIPAVVAMRDMK